MKKLSAKHFQYAIADIAAALQQQIEADCEGFPSDPKASFGLASAGIIGTYSSPGLGACRLHLLSPDVFSALLHHPRRQRVAYMA